MDEITRCFFCNKIIGINLNKGQIKFSINIIRIKLKKYS